MSPDDLQDNYSSDSHENYDDLRNYEASYKYSKDRYSPEELKSRVELSPFAYETKPESKESDRFKDLKNRKYSPYLEHLQREAIESFRLKQHILKN